MEEALDNPVWNAMNSCNSNLAFGSGGVKIFREDIGPFAGLKNIDRQSLKQLADLLINKRVIAIVTPGTPQIPEFFKIIRQGKVLQMIGKGLKTSPVNHQNIVTLDTEHVPQMLELNRLTNPGPFLTRTIEFGNYKGIFQSNRLAAMAGQRMHINTYVEVSAVCTHPDHVGKGYSTSLITDQVNQIISGGNIPFLHVMADNEKAINLYEHLGFTKRMMLNLYVIQKLNN